MSNILILGAGTQGLAILKSLHSNGHRIVELVVDKGNYADSSRYIDKIYYGEDMVEDSDSYLLYVLDVMNREMVDVVIPTGDSTAEFICKNEESFPTRVKCKFPSYKNFLRGYDKSQLMHHCESKGYPHPRTIDLSVIDILDDIVRFFDYPAMLKPNCTTGGRGMVEINSYDELIDKYSSLHERFGDYHLQKFIKAGGKQEKIQLYIDENKQLVAHSVQQKIRWYPNKGGSNTCAVSIEDEKMVAVCYQILKDIDWLGFADFDTIEDPDTGELLIMEINPRLPACIKGSIVAGIDWGEILVNGALGLPQKQYKYKEGVVLRHLGLDMLWFLHAENRWHAKPNWFKFFGRKIYYQDMNGILDPMPFLTGTWSNVKKLFDPEFRKAKKGV